MARRESLLEVDRMARRRTRHLPTGNELIDRYVTPLAQHPAIAPHVRYHARVDVVGRKDFDKVRTKGRDAAAV